MSEVGELSASVTAAKESPSLSSQDRTRFIIGGRHRWGPKHRRPKGYRDKDSLVKNRIVDELNTSVIQPETLSLPIDPWTDKTEVDIREHDKAKKKGSILSWPRKTLAVFTTLLALLGGSSSYVAEKTTHDFLTNDKVNSQSVNSQIGKISEVNSNITATMGSAPHK